MSRDGYPVGCHSAGQQLLGLLALLKHIISHSIDQEDGQGMIGNDSVVRKCGCISQWDVQLFAASSAAIVILVQVS
jgi:hypothetical protein